GQRDAGPAERARTEAERLMEQARAGTWPPPVVSEWTLDAALARLAERGGAGERKRGRGSGGAGERGSGGAEAERGKGAARRQGGRSRQSGIVRISNRMTSPEGGRLDHSNIESLWMWL